MTAYEPLFRDIALTAGMTALGASFVPTTIPVTDLKTAKPGLNMSLSTAEEPAHTAWVDNRTGAYGVPLGLDGKKVPDVSVVIVLKPHALSEDKGFSLRAARHEMVHGGTS